VGDTVMVNEKKCEGCQEAHTCKDAYHRIGQSKGSSVVFKVLIAFVVPILVFIASLIVFEPVLARFINSQRLLTIANFLFALSVTFVIMLVIKFVNKIVKHK
jgi:phosphotransferase system  glucose/maltose/N-acetylglucosamine-specific IIC component